MYLGERRGGTGERDKGRDLEEDGENGFWEDRGELGEVR